ncbi:MAG TPA: hypothetical protein VFR94_16175 [Nitrososphaeraceae archaeon]|nr:hypothetical protein [Nitrososphaeraceae archaeon]
MEEPRSLVEASVAIKLAISPFIYPLDIGNEIKAAIVIDVVFTVVNLGC